ncbi:hypothetical protein EJ03DRAFT_73451 [Teratosphaeria nubilosa]|uniref:ABC transporter domain-containing protein n=1 Tax=Teratosphaeria nubilosa TaxID=161662 RepID=A0A6G1LLY2_9PEZI|nr:hypothetical protein EJ03DRAFT_73451 [Teratosphaeria nubilosa]
MESTRKAAVAYCSPTPWLENSTYRGNIVGASPWDRARYNDVVDACLFGADFQHLESGDLTVVGTKGIDLSGGQKQRICLARAIYARCRIELIDAAFSSVDAQTAQLLSERCANGGPLSLCVNQAVRNDIYEEHGQLLLTELQEL